MALTVSVIIPVYNRAHLIGRCLESIRQQTQPVDEVILVDDGSSDDLAAALGPWKGRLPLKLIRQPNAGAAVARSTGAAAASGDILAFLDSDDAWLPDKTALQLPLFQTDEAKLLAVTTGFVIADEPAGGVSDGGQEHSRQDIRLPPSRQTLDDHLWVCDVSPGSTLMVSRQLWQAVGPQNRQLPRLEDWDWLLRLQRAGGCLEVVAHPLATIWRGKAPPPAAVGQACRLMWQAHAPSLSWRQRCHFRAALAMEQASARRAAGQRLSFLSFLLLSLVCWPSRTVSFVAGRISGALPLRHGQEQDKGAGGNHGGENSGSS